MVKKNGTACSVCVCFHAGRLGRLGALDLLDSFTDYVGVVNVLPGERLENQDSQ